MIVPNGVSPDFVEQTGPVVSAFRDAVMGMATGSYGPLSDREKEIVDRIAFTLTQTLIQTHQIMGESYKEMPAVVAEWERLKKGYK